MAKANPPLSAAQRKRREAATLRQRRRKREEAAKRRAKPKLKQPTAGRRAAGPAGPIPEGWPILAIKDQRDGRQLTALITTEGATTSGYGGWEEIARQRRLGFPDWSGQPLLKMSIECMFDGWQTEETVDRSCRLLESFAQYSDGKRPPTLRIDGPVPHTDKTWVIENIDWGDTIRGDNGHRRRVEFTLSLLQWVDADFIKKSSAKRRRKGAGARRTATVRAHGKYKTGPNKGKRKPETLMQFAGRVLDDSSKWKAVKQKNKQKCKDPRKLKIGMELKLP